MTRLSSTATATETPNTASRKRQRSTLDENQLPKLRRLGWIRFQKDFANLDPTDVEKYWEGLSEYQQDYYGAQDDTDPQVAHAKSRRPQQATMIDGVCIESYLDSDTYLNPTNGTFRVLEYRGPNDTMPSSSTTITADRSQSKIIRKGSNADESHNRKNSRSARHTVGNQEHSADTTSASKPTILRENASWTNFQKANRGTPRLQVAEMSQQGRKTSLVQSAWVNGEEVATERKIQTEPYDSISSSV